MSNPAEISEIMANAKKLIEEKKAQLGIKIGNVNTQNRSFTQVILQNLNSF